MKICSKKDIRVVTGILAASVILGGCASAAPQETTAKPGRDDTQVKTEIDLKKIAGTEFDSGKLDGEYRKYCFEIFSQTVGDHGGKDENVMISPASVMLALDMLAAGSKGDSLKQLTDLFADGADPMEQQAYAAALMKKINDSKKVDFSCANAVWSNSGILGDTVNTEYVDYIKDTFRAEYSAEPFNAKTPDEINGWVDEHTDHMIQKVIDELDPMDVMVLVNAISFDAKWDAPYMDDQLGSGDFTASDGSVLEANYLNGKSPLYYETEKATGFIKEYEGGEYAFIAILPADDSVSANEFAKNFTADDYEEFVNSATDEYDVYTKMPAFSSDFEASLTGTLSKLGAPDIFDGSKADLSGIAGNRGDLFVSDVIHKTHIEVDSEGTRAAAVTAITVRANGIEFSEKESRTVICDRPFVYAIVDTETMTPVFIGTVNAV